MQLIHRPLRSSRRLPRESRRAFVEKTSTSIIFYIKIKIASLFKLNKRFIKNKSRFWDTLYISRVSLVFIDRSSLSVWENPSQGDANESDRNSKIAGSKVRLVLVSILNYSTLPVHRDILTGLRVEMMTNEANKK